MYINNNNCYENINLVILAGVCQLFLPPENGYYVDDIQWIYYSDSNLSSIQVACKDEYVLADANNNTANGTLDGISFCQPNGSWSQEFYCLCKHAYIQFIHIYIDTRFHYVYACTCRACSFHS